MSNYNADFKNGAVNPYNFVQLGNGVERTEPKRGSNTGVIHCSMTNATPIALPDLSASVKVTLKDKKGKEFVHSTADFFKVDGKPVIPGSEIRGVIRSAYETLSNSCLSVNNNNILSARSSDVRKPGIIRFETKDMKWHLYEAESKKLKYDGSEDFNETADTFKRSWRNYRYIKEGKKSKADYSGGKKEVSYKFTTHFKEIIVEDIESAVSDYCTVCKLYADGDDKIKKYIVEPSRDGKSYPVYYREFVNDGKKYVYLTPAQISRSVFRNRVDDLLGTYRHCDDTKNVCEACGLFGMIGKSGSEPSAIASRVRFSDAVLEKESKLFRATLKELASPKISSVEFYSTAPNMKYLWNYDTKGVKLNGRKFYFHHNGDYRTEEKTNRNLTTELIDKSAVFKFDVFFEDLTDRELSRLIWTLAIGENNTDGKQMHKLGHGKPLGLGSVKITVDSVVKREFDTQSMTYSEKDMNTAEYFAEIPFDDSSEYFKDYMAITDFNFLDGEKVAYPYGDDRKGKETSVGTLVWFKANHNDGKMVKAGEECSVGYHLPEIRAEKHRLPALIAGDDYGKNTGSGGKNRTENNYSGKMSFDSKRKTDSNKVAFMCKKCKTWNEVTKNTPFPKSNSPVICRNCGNKFFETY